MADLFNSRHYTAGKVQRRATKFILNDYTSDYKSHLIKLQLLPLVYVYVYELSDISFFIKSVRSPNSSFNILNYVSFPRGATRSSNTKHFHRAANNCITSKFIFIVFLNFGMLFLKPI